MIRTGNSPEEQLTRFKTRVTEAKEKLAVLKSNRDRLLQDLKPFGISTVEQAKKKAVVLQKEADTLDSEVTLLLSRAGKLLERFDG